MFVQHHNFGTESIIRCGQKWAPHNSGDHLHQFFELEMVFSGEIEVTLNGKPNCIICSTQKGQGVKFMEERPSAWHIGGFSDETLAETLELIDAYTKERLAEVE